MTFAHSYLTRVSVIDQSLHASLLCNALKAVLPVNNIHRSMEEREILYLYYFGELLIIGAFNTLRQAKKNHA